MLRADPTAFFARAEAQGLYQEVTVGGSSFVARVRQVLLLVAASTVLGGLICLPASAAARTSTPPSGQIAFVRDGDIYIMNADGSGVRRLTTSSRREGQPAWSPDGRTIAFIRAGIGEEFDVCQNEIWLMDADGGNQRRIPFELSPQLMPGTTHEQTYYSVADIAWAPDGKEIAVGASAQSWYPNMADGLFALQLYLVHPDGTSRRRLGPLIYGMGMQGLGWRPNGSELLLNTWNRGWGELVSCDVASGATAAPYPNRAMWNATWSPDGTRIAVCALDADGEAGGPGSPKHLIVIDQSTRQERDLWAGAWDGIRELHPTWSPDGRWLACSYEAKDQSDDTLLLSADGSEYRLLKGDADEPAWRPTGAAGRQDTDGDGLPDEWETKGVDTNDDKVIDVDLPAMGADPNREDIFVEIDWMVEAPTTNLLGWKVGGHSHEPKAEALRKVMKAFKAQGIALHIDAGPGSVMDPYHPEKKWGEYSEAGNASAAGPVLEVKDLTMGEDWKNLRKRNFQRVGVFHYCLFAHGWGGKRRTGVSWAPGDWLLVADGMLSDGAACATEQAGTFMHELGHSLGLGDGGGDDVYYKPNYLSVMNYSFQTSGLMNGKGEFGAIDYSHEKLPTLNEASLNEGDGIGPSSADDLGTLYWRDGWSGPITTTAPIRVNSPFGPINWNGFWSDRETGIQEDLNTGGPEAKLVLDEKLAGWDDWDNLVFGGSESGGWIGPAAFAAMSGPARQGRSSAGGLCVGLPYEDFVASGLVLRDYRVSVTADGGNVVMATRGARELLLSLKVTNEGLGPDTYSLQAWGLGGASLGDVPASVQLSADASETVSVPITLPAGTPGGLVGSVRLLATSTGSPEISDEVEVAVYVESPAPTVTLKLSGLKGGAVKRGGVVTATGAVTPLGLAGSRVTLSVQRKTGATWVELKATFASISPKGKYSWKYKPAKKGTYRMQAMTAKTITLAAATTKWLAFTVK